MTPVRLLGLETRAFLLLLAITVVHQLLTGRMNLSGLISRKDGSGTVGPERLPLLLATLALSAKYIGQVAHSTSAVMPDVSSQWLYVFGASSGVYASVKAWTTLSK